MSSECKLSFSPNQGRNWGRNENLRRYLTEALLTFSVREFRERDLMPDHTDRLSLLFILSALATEGFRKKLPYAYALFALTENGRESEDFCGGRNLKEAQPSAACKPSSQSSSRLPARLS